ncbi:MAG: AraC family transcriptional regulator, partial [bacterium]
KPEDFKNHIAFLKKSDNFNWRIQFIRGNYHTFPPGQEIKIKSWLMMDNLLIHIFKGSIGFICGPEKVILRKGQIGIFPEGAIIDCFRPDNRFLEHQIIHFYSLTLSGEELFTFLKAPLVINPRRESLAPGLITRIVQEANKEPHGWKTSCQSLCESMVYDLIRTCGDQFAASTMVTGQIYSRTGKVIKFIRENIGKNIKIHELAEIMNLSEPHFIRIFRGETGLTPVNYFQKLKILEAVKIKRRRNLSWIKIAESLGFSDVYYFYRVFKKVCRVPPNQYLAKPEM